MKAKEIILLIFIIIAGVTFYHIHTGKINFDWADGFFYSYDEFTYEETHEVSPPYPPELHITNSHGEIRINGIDENRITIIFTKKIRRRNEEQADEVAEDLHMIMNKDDRQLTLATNRSDFRRKNFRIHFEISCPQGMAVKLTNSYGQIKVAKIGEVDITNSHGEVFAEGVMGNLTLHNSYEDVEIQDVSGECRINSRHSDVTAAAIQGSTLIAHRYGKIHLESLGQDVTVEGSHSRVFGRDLTGPVEIETSYDRITLVNVGPTTIYGNHCPMDIDGVQANLEIKNKYDLVKLSNIRGNLSVTGDSVKVLGKQIVGESIYISSSHQDVELQEFSGKTTIIISHGDLDLIPAPLTFPIEVKGSYSGIRLTWPGEEKYPIEAQVKQGNIHWALTAEPSMRVENGTSILKAFLEENAPGIRLSTTYDSIRIDQQ